MIQKDFLFTINLFRVQNKKYYFLEPEPPFLLGAGTDPILPEPESAPGPRPSRAVAAKEKWRLRDNV